MSRLEGGIEKLPLVLTGGCTIDSEDIPELRSIRVTVVDDNDPLEDNIPYVGSPVTEGGLYDGQVWVGDGINPRKAENHHRSGPKLPSVSPSIISNLTLLDYFLILFRMDYVKCTMLPVMNRRLPEGGPHV